MNLNERDWKAFNLEDIFVVKGTTTTHPKYLQSNGDVPRITCAATNNALDGFYKNQATESGKVLTVDSATIGTVFYQEADFIATDHVEKLTLRDGVMSKELGLFLQAAITHSTAGKYNYGYKFAQVRIKRQKIMLPTTLAGQPDYEFMENYMREREAELIIKYREWLGELESAPAVAPLDEIDWKDFVIDDIFTVSAGKRLTKADMDSGDIPFIGSSDLNNGVTNWVGSKNKSYDKNVLGVNYNGSVVENFYHPYGCVFSDDVKRLHLRYHEDNEFVLLFCKTLILQQKSKYTYGYKFNGQRMTRQKILLPVTADDQPNYIYMENYSKHLIATQYRRYLDYLTRTGR